MAWWAVRVSGSGLSEKEKKVFPGFIFLLALIVFLGFITLAWLGRGKGTDHVPVAARSIADSHETGQTHALIFYHQLDSFDLSRPVWKDPQYGVLTERKVWQDAASALYYFLELRKKQRTQAEYAKGRADFRMALDRLKRAKLEGSFGGRGRQLMSLFSVIASEIDAVANLPAADFEMKRTPHLDSVDQWTCTAFDDFRKSSGLPRDGDSRR